MTQDLKATSYTLILKYLETLLYIFIYIYIYFTKRISFECKAIFKSISPK